jgi:hypothetical protein
MDISYTPPPQIRLRWEGDGRWEGQGGLIITHYPWRRHVAWAAEWLDRDGNVRRAYGSTRRQLLQAVPYRVTLEKAPADV